MPPVLTSLCNRTHVQMRAVMDTYAVTTSQRFNSFQVLHLTSQNKVGLLYVSLLQFLLRTRMKVSERAACDLRFQMQH